jgi:hypothetical protein
MTGRIKRLRGLKVAEISSVDSAANPGARIVLRKRDDPGLVTVIRKADGQSWSLPADSALLPGLRENAQRLGFEIEGDQIAPPKQEHRTMKSREIVKIAKAAVAAGEPIPFNAADLFQTMQKRADREIDGATSAIRFAKYCETADGRIMLAAQKAAPAAPVALPATAYDRDQAARQDHIRKADVAREGRDRRMQQAIQSIANGLWASGQYGSFEAARAAAENSPTIRSLRSRDNIYTRGAA